MRQTTIDIRDTIKAILDKDCYSKNPDCRKGMVLTGTVASSSGCFNMCFLCHDNDGLAMEIAEAVTTPNGK